MVACGVLVSSRPGVSVPGYGIDREDPRMSSKRQTTFAKMERERKVREKRALKMEKKQAQRMADTGDSGVPAQPAGPEEPRSPES